jgi:hypothetical protein
MNITRYTFAFCLFCFPLASFSGCGKPVDPEAAGRETVAGTILLNGQPPVGETVIAFAPLDGVDTTAGGGGLVSAEGKYSLTGRNGVKPGKYRVRISCSATYDRKTKAPRTAETEFGHDYQVRILPPTFNEKSTLEFEVVAGKPNVFDYNIETSFVPNTRPTKMVLPN